MQVIRLVLTGEKTKGRKRHIVTDIMGNLLAIHVHAANEHDTKNGGETFLKALYRYPTLVGVCADAGYRGTFFIFITLFLGLVCDISEKIKPIAITNDNIIIVNLILCILKQSFLNSLCAK